MKLSEIITNPSFKKNTILKINDNNLLYYTEDTVSEFKTSEFNKALYSIIVLSKSSQPIGLILKPKYKWTQFANGVIIEHNFKLKEKPEPVSVDFSFWSDLHIITNVSATMSMLCKSGSETPNY